MADLKLRFGCDLYAHMKAFVSGATPAEGIEISWEHGTPGRTFRKLLVDGEFDVSELGITFYLGTLRQEPPPFIAIPVFPSRSFRHSAIYVRAGSEIEKPGDIPGKRLGELHFYGHDGGVWPKGILSDEYGLPKIHGDHFAVGGVRGPERHQDWTPVRAPNAVRQTYIGPDDTLDAMMRRGELDAIYSAHVPPGLLDGSGTVRRLFPDPVATERAWFARTGMYPIMHLVVIRRSLYEEHPWVARAITDAMTESKRRVDGLYREWRTQMHRLLMVPWLSEHYVEVTDLMGDDPWPYGIGANRKVLETYLRYQHEQGLTDRLYAIEDLFAPETLTD